MAWHLQGGVVLAHCQDGAQHHDMGPDQDPQQQLQESEVPNVSLCGRDRNLGSSTDA